MIKNLLNKRGKELLDSMFHSEKIIFKKSTFFAHCCEIKKVEDSKLALEALKESNKKIKNATHNIIAYRLYDNEKKEIEEYRDDDGESGAGDKMLFILQKLDIIDVWVCVTRNYGGVKLGGNRFKLINQACRDVLKEAKIIK
eukprot:TRINITY_DN618_c1_g1_i1.p1 TRINITY_DN618_c1_g1~~TRINITY_DN618_c1_g1_i1.p1  ORF type:complete len:142 (+),score=24.36 TRINITY_DN618_c1_g1_i1:146-571(+)